MTNCMSLDMFYTVLVVLKSPPLIVHLNHGYISVMMLQLSFVQPSMNGLTKSDEIASYHDRQCRQYSVSSGIL